jgi:hypothetical protein
MKKLEIKHLAPYLPYGLKCQWGADEASITGLIRNAVVLIGEHWEESQKTDLSNIKPLLCPLSDLTKEDKDGLIKIYDIIMWCEGNCDAYEDWADIFCEIPSEELIIQAPYEVVQELLKQHFDVFGLIEQGLAIPI